MRRLIKSLRQTLGNIDTRILTGSLVVLGLLLIVIGYTAPRLQNSTLLQVLGALVFGAGVSAWIGTITGREAIRQQSAKDANLSRKRETYRPLYQELKALDVAFADAHSGAAPAPQWIVMSEEPPRQGAVPGPSFKLWGEYRRDYRDTDFKESTQLLLDQLNAHALAYNGAVNATRKPMIGHVAQAIDNAVADLRDSPEYKHWAQRQAKEAEHPKPLGHSHVSPHDWYGYIDDVARSAELSKHTIGEIIANEWFRVFQGVSEAQTLGWLIASRPDKAADHAWRKYPEGMTYPRPDQAWIYGVFENAWPNIQHDKWFISAIDIWATLEKSLETVEKIMDTGLKQIQQEFEGGEPRI